MSQPGPETDATLVERCRAGDATAWAALVQRFQRLVYAIAKRAGLDEHAAADVFQTVFSRLLEHLPRLAQPERVQAWVVTTAKREALRQRQLAQRHPSLTRTDDAEGDGLEDRLADESPLAEDARPPCSSSTCCAPGWAGWTSAAATCCCCCSTTTTPRRCTRTWHGAGPCRWAASARPARAAWANCAS